MMMAAWKPFLLLAKVSSCFVRVQLASGMANAYTQCKCLQHYSEGVGKPVYYHCYVDNFLPEHTARDAVVIVICNKSDE